MSSEPLNKDLYKKATAKARKRFDTYPSLFASAWIQKEYKKMGGKYSHKKPSKMSGTKRWFGEKWTDVKYYLKTGKYIPCGSNLKKVKACRPLKRLNSKTPLTIRELLKLHSKRKLLQLATSKEKNMKGRVNWKRGTFKPSRSPRKTRRRSVKKTRRRTPRKTHSRKKTHRSLKGGQIIIYLVRLRNKPKKWQVTITKNNKKRTVRFGASGYEDYTIHKDKKRRERYISRHRKRENWTKQGITTPGFWSRWLLWNKPTIKSSIKNIEKKFKIHVVLRRQT